MDKERQTLPSKVHYSKVSLPGRVGHLYETHLWLQLLFFLSILGFLFVLFHHYLPTFRDLWYDFAPSEKEIVFTSSEDMHFVDEKNGQFLIWYESYSDRYRFFHGPGFYSRKTVSFGLAEPYAGVASFLGNLQIPARLPSS